jgi:hypothetical protein
LREVNGIDIAIYQQLLHSEIEYHSGSLPQAIKMLAELLLQIDSLGRNREFVKAIIDHNMAIILTQYQKTAAAQVLFRKSLKYVSTAEEMNSHN